MTNHTLIEGLSKKIPKRGAANTIDLVFACHDCIATNYITCLKWISLTSSSNLGGKCDQESFQA
jgi:hypothetical protein